MSDNSTRPQRRSHGFLTEKGQEKLDLFLGEFLTERGKRTLYSLLSINSVGFLGIIFLTCCLTLFTAILATQLTLEVKKVFDKTSVTDSNAVGGAEEDQLSSVKSFERIPADKYPGKWVQPLPGNLYITQGRHGRRSDAVDLRAEVGTQVYATRAGRIILSETGYNNGHGNYIIIDHGDGVTSVYCHLLVLYVVYGQIVQQGQVIGLSGNTGRTTGPHLHFAVRGKGVENPLF